MPTLPDAFAYVVWLTFLISSKLFDGLAMPDPFAFLHGSALPDVFAYVVWLAFLISSELFDGLALPDPFAFLDGMALATIVLAGTILLVSLDDFYIDLFYWLRRIKRALTHKRVYRPLTVEALRGEPQKPIAIMVPAWHEHDVIAMMVENLVSTVEYTNYVVFVGTYPNDQPTIDEVERVTRRYRQVHRVEIPHGGPTSKADCLNWVVQAIFAHERLAGEDFAGCVLHDSEDVLHPLELAFFNHLLPRMDFIQIPVTSLERHYSEVVAGTYMDEFAEWHAKDLVVREMTSGVVPSAGVGTCFSRNAMAALAAETDNQPFNTDSLTEDYDIGNRLGALGMKLIFALYDVQFRVTRRPWFGLGRPYQRTLTMPLCVREFFPDRFRAAYRQKARWTLGISLQGWQQLGWRGGATTKLQLYRDRKAIVTPFIAILAYVVFTVFLACWALGGDWFDQWRAQSWVFADPRAQLLIKVNLGILTWRVVQRAYFVNRIYGFDHALLSVPRMVVGNFISFAAACRAWRMFLAHVLFGKRLVWDKTAHEFPSAEKLVAERKRLGELLTLWQAIDESKLSEALQEQEQTAAPLGRVLLDKGWINEDLLADAIAYQAGLQRALPDFATFGRCAAALPAEACRRLGVIAIEWTNQGRIVIAAARPPAMAVIDELTALLGEPPLVRIATEREIAAGLAALETFASDGGRAQGVAAQAAA
jgi:bacteriophage N4 adsorption protein B